MTKWSVKAPGPLVRLQLYGHGSRTSDRSESSRNCTGTLVFSFQAVTCGCIANRTSTMYMCLQSPLWCDWGWWRSLNGTLIDSWKIDWINLSFTGFLFSDTLIKSIVIWCSLYCTTGSSCPVWEILCHFCVFIPTLILMPNWFMQKAEMLLPLSFYITGCYTRG